MGQWGTVISSLAGNAMQNSQSGANSASNAARTGLGGGNKPIQQLGPQNTQMVNYMDYLKSRGGY